MWSESLTALLLMGSGTKVNHFLMWGDIFSRWLVSLRFGWTYPDTSVLSHDLIGAPQKDTLSTRKGCPPRQKLQLLPSVVWWRRFIPLALW